MVAKSGVFPRGRSERALGMDLRHLTLLRIGCDKSARRVPAKVVDRERQARLVKAEQLECSRVLCPNGTRCDEVREVETRLCQKVRKDDFARKRAFVGVDRLRHATKR